MNTPAVLVEDWFNMIDAPVKSYTGLKIRS